MAAVTLCDWLWQAVSSVTVAMARSGGTKRSGDLRLVRETMRISLVLQL